MKNLLLILTIFTSCTIQTRKQNDNSIKQSQPEKKYTKVISDSTNKLAGKVESLEVEHTVWGCACPQWIQTKDLNLNDTTIKFIDLHFYIEPADRELDLPIYFDAFRHKLKIEGQFYEKKDYPQGTVEMEEPMPKAKVFRYTKIKVIDKPTFKPDTKIETLILDYNAIACTCAQWSESKYSTNPDRGIHYWLEPDNEKLIQADTLLNGENLPIQIKVTGQIVSENGFPKSESLSKVGQGEAGKVFRYTKIEVLKNGQKKTATNTNYANAD